MFLLNLVGKLFVFPFPVYPAHQLSLTKSASWCFRAWLDEERHIRLRRKVFRV